MQSNTEMKNLTSTYETIKQSLPAYFTIDCPSEKNIRLDTIHEFNYKFPASEVVDMSQFNNHDYFLFAKYGNYVIGFYIHGDNTIHFTVSEWIKIFPNVQYDLPMNGTTFLNDVQNAIKQLKENHIWMIMRGMGGLKYADGQSNT